MKLLDSSVLLHAYDPDFRQHQQSRGWIEKTFSDPDKVGLAWVPVLAFLRISTKYFDTRTTASPQARPQKATLIAARTSRGS